MRSALLAFVAIGLPLASGFSVSGVSQPFVVSAGLFQHGCSLSPPATCASNMLGVTPALRGTRSGLLGATAVEYSVKKGEELKNGGSKYTFTVTVDGAMSKDSFSEWRTCLLANDCVLASRRRPATSP